MENFEITSGRIRVTDPCYTKDTWCSGVLENCLTGNWKASKLVYGNELTGGWGNRIAELQIWHEDYLGGECYENSGIDVGVDSGQAGFFDDALYPDGETGEYGDLNTFYGKVCDGTAGEAKIYEEPLYNDETISKIEEIYKSDGKFSDENISKLIENMKTAMVKRERHEYLGIANVGFGVASSSGYGDGGYDCFIRRDHEGRIVAAKIVFIGDESEEDEDYDCEDEDE